MKALQKVAGAALALETCRQDLTYSWKHQESGSEFDRVTLFEEEQDVTASSLGSAVRNSLSDWRPDLVAIPGWGDPSALFALDWAHLNGVPAVIMSDSREQDAPRRVLSEAAKSIVVRSAAGGLVAGGQHAKYLNALGMPMSRIVFGYDVVDNEHFAGVAAATRAEVGARTRLNLPQRYILAIGRLVPKKNLLALIKGHALLHQNRDNVPDLLIVGNGPDESFLKAQSGEGVFFRGFADYNTVPALMALAEGMVLPSTVEQWGLVVNEAMAAGCPVVVSRCAGASELVEDGINGFVTEPEPKGIAEAMERLLLIDRVPLVSAAQSTIGAWGPSRFAAGLLNYKGVRPLSPFAARLISPILRAMAKRVVGTGIGA